MHMHSCFVIFCSMARRHSLQSRLFCFLVMAYILSAVYTYEIMTKLNKICFKFRPSSGSCLVPQVHFYWSYMFMKNFSYWKVQQLASDIVVTFSELHISHALHFENSLFKIEQLTMLFAAQEILYWFQVIHFYMMM